LNAGHHWTDFKCTSSQEQIFNGTLYTKSLVVSTTIHSGQILRFYTYLEIDDIFVKTMGMISPTSACEATYTGSFTPTISLVASTTLTAYPLLKTADLDQPMSTARCSTADPGQSKVTEHNVRDCQSGSVSSGSTSRLPSMDIDEHDSVAAMPDNGFSTLVPSITALTAVSDTPTAAAVSMQ
jgi:hypothetical protein